MELPRVASCLLFINKIDAITLKRESAQCEMECRIVAQFLTWLDDDNKPVMVNGATNRPDALDPALRRAGRFGHGIGITVPGDGARAQILRATPGYVGADLGALTGAAGIIAVKWIFK
ncbi:hypothetical protein BJV78DRAFT_1251406, partial [Lactifluus subvellereus]